MTAEAKAALAAALVLVAVLGVWGSRHWARDQPVERADARSGAPLSSSDVPAEERYQSVADAAAADPPPVATVAVEPIPAGTIFGRILDADGKPARGARVRVEGNLTRDGITAMGDGTHEVSRDAEVDDDGDYRFEGLAPGGYYLRAECEGYAPQRSGHGYIIDAKGGASWSARLSRGGTIAVVVRDAAGAPRLDVEVETGDAHAQTDAAGQAAFLNLPAGAYPVIVCLAGDDEARIVKVEDGVTTTLEIVVGAVLRGTVTLDDRTPVSGAMWAALDQPLGAQCFAEGWADSSGRYEFRWLGPGEWKVRMGNTGVSSESRPVRVGAEPVTSLDLVLMRPSISGRLVSSGTGFSPGMVNLFPDGRRGGIRGISVAEHGTFVFHDLSPGEYVISVQPHRSGYARREVSVKVEAGQRLEGLEIPIEEIRYGDVELEISDGNGALTEAVQMFVGDPEGRKLRKSTSMAPAPVSPGRFKLTLECGKQVITLRGKKGEVKVDVDVEEGKTVYKTVRLPE